MFISLHRTTYKALEAAGYTGLVGYELFPARSTREAVKAILDAG